jgi:pyruvate dehydrogenase E1 component
VGAAFEAGFLVGGTAGRTTLPGEGLQHQDGQSHLLASPVPNLVSYDPAYAYELAEIVRAGIERMQVRNEDVFYYLTVGNEPYVQPPMPSGEGVREGIVRGMYQLRPVPEGAAPGAPRAHLLASGAILNEAIAAQALLHEQFGVAAEVWSVTSWTELRRDGLDAERWNMLHPGAPPRVPWVTQNLDGHGGAFVAASDYMKALPDGVAKWVPGPFVTLGTDGFGRSASRAELRDFFEVDAKHIALATMHALARTGAVDAEAVRAAITRLGINPEQPNPAHA